MRILNWFFSNESANGSARKKVFISFAVEDIKYRDYLVEQARKKHSPFDFIDMSVKKKWDEQQWQKRCRTKIKRCDGFIALLSKNTYHATGARWEMKCANEEGLNVIGMHIFSKKRGAIPAELKQKTIITWNWENLEEFINQL